MPLFRISLHYSYKTALLASFLLLLLLSKPASVFAADSYSVDNVVVDTEGEDPNQAKTKALAQGEVDSFKQLIERLNPAKATDIIAKVPPAQISTMIRGYEIIEEKITGAHYHAMLKYNYDQEKIQPLLEAQTNAANPSQPAAETHASKAVLVLPVYREGSKLKLWQDDNKWRTSWYESALESSGGMAVAPLGDIDDRVDVDDTNVETATAKSLSRMYGRYGVGEIYVLTAYFNQKADPKPALEVTLHRITPTKEDTTHMDFTIRSTETLDDLMVRASGEIARYLQKLQTINPNKIEFERLKDINARVNVSTITEWEALRKRLLTHGNIVSIKLTSISFYETSMVITFKGTPDMLGKTLVASGLRVMQDGDSLVLALK